MKALILVALFASILFGGCAPKAEETAATPETTATAPAPESGGGVAPMGSGAAGGVTPMGGTENLGGGSGGGVGNAAKDQARRAAAGGGGTAPMPEEGN